MCNVGRMRYCLGFWRGLVAERASRKRKEETKRSEVNIDIQLRPMIL